MLNASARSRSDHPPCRLLLFLRCYLALREISFSKQAVVEHVIRHPDVMPQNCRQKTKLGRGTNVFSKPVIYMQIHAGHVAARRIGAGSVRKECGALSHPRTLMGDFMAVEACFRAVFRELASSGLFPVKPSVLVHLVPEAVGGYTNVEERAFQEAAASAGARICKVVTGRLPLSDSQVGEALR